MRRYLSKVSLRSRRACEHNMDGKCALRGAGATLIARLAISKSGSSWRPCRHILNGTAFEREFLVDMWVVRSYPSPRSVRYLGHDTVAAIPLPTNSIAISKTRTDQNTYRWSKGTELSGSCRPEASIVSLEIDSRTYPFRYVSRVMKNCYPRTST